MYIYDAVTMWACISYTTQTGKQMWGEIQGVIWCYI